MFSHQHGFQYYPPHHYHGHGYVGYTLQHVGSPDYYGEQLRHRPSPSHVWLEFGPWTNIGDYMSDEVFEVMSAAVLARFIERNEERDNGGEGSSRYDRHERYRELDAALGDVGHRERRRVSLQLGRDFNHAIHRRHLSPNSRLVQEQDL